MGNSHNLYQAWQLMSAGIDAAEAGRHTQALAYMERALQLAPDVADIHHNRGMVLNLMDRYHEAIASFTRALELGGENSKSYEHRGLSYSRLGEAAAARRDMRRALELKPDSVMALINLAHSYQTSGDLDQALLYSDRAVRTDPNHAHAVALRGEIHLARNEKAAAFADLQVARRLIDSGRDSTDPLR